jgi:hypothetical protein
MTVCCTLYSLQPAVAAWLSPSGKPRSVPEVPATGEEIVDVESGIAILTP